MSSKQNPDDGGRISFFYDMYYVQDKDMLDSIYASFPNVKCLNLKDQFIWLMSQEDETCLKEIARFVSHCMELRDKELDKLLCINCSQSTLVVT